MLVAQSCPALCNPMDGTLPESSVHGRFFSKQEYWSVLPFPSPGHLPNPGIEPRSPALQADALLSQPPAQLVKNLPAMQEAQVSFLGQEDQLEKG